MTDSPDGVLTGSDRRDARGLRAFRLYVRTLAAAMPRALGLAVTLTVLGALTEGVALLILVPLLHSIGIDVQQGNIGNVARWLAAAFGWIGLPLNLISVLLLYVALITGDGLIRRWQTVTYCALQGGFTRQRRNAPHAVVAGVG